MANKKLNFIQKMPAAKKHAILRMALSIAIGLTLATVLILTTSDKPMKSLSYFYTAPFQNLTYFGYWMQKMIPLIFTGTAVSLMFSANQFNLGMEGCFLMAGQVAAITNIYLFPNQPVLGIIFGCLFGMLVGALIAFIPALLNKLWNASIMVTSLMMNYICLYFSMYMLFTYFKNPKSTKNTYDWCKQPIMTIKAKIGNQTLNIFISLFIALIVAYGAYLFLYRTKMGFKLRQVGQNSNFAKYVGISVPVVAILAQVIGGAIAGLGGACEIMSLYTNYSWVELTGFGWDGVTMAVFAKNNPKYVPLAALFIAYLRTGAMVMSFKTNIQLDLTSVVEGVIILFLLAERFLSGTYRKMIVAEAEREKQNESLENKEA